MMPEAKEVAAAMVCFILLSWRCSPLVITLCRETARLPLYASPEPSQEKEQAFRSSECSKKASYATAPCERDNVFLSSGCKVCIDSSRGG
ncbi:hypothetical protein CC78DRAFT_43423 [Lojkania enalia]|uniref:Secreted protein n=1 Tax=Lojkania enalia TaxID=147567 RepID=A0A9P4K298_9PLEO|nr:hypothetical protein CC78DRAFT_43423 [Didymosphaeria enalia]